MGVFGKNGACPSFRAIGEQVPSNGTGQTSTAITLSIGPESDFFVAIFGVKPETKNSGLPLNRLRE